MLSCSHASGITTWEFYEYKGSTFKMCNLPIYWIIDKRNVRETINIDFLHTVKLSKNANNNNNNSKKENNFLKHEFLHQCFGNTGSSLAAIDSYLICLFSNFQHQPGSSRSLAWLSSFSLTKRNSSLMQHFFLLFPRQLGKHNPCRAAHQNVFYFCFFLYNKAPQQFFFLPY